MTYIVKDQYINHIQPQSGCKQVCSEEWTNDERYRQDEGCKQIEQGLVYFLENKQFGADFPPSKLPAEKDVGHVVVNAVDEEEIPAIEALFPYRHPIWIVSKNKEV